MWRYARNTLQPFVVQKNVLCVLRLTGYPVLPLSCFPGSGNRFCCLFVGLCEMIFSPPKGNSSRREGFLEAVPPVKTCKCHSIAECFDWLWEWVSTWAVLSLLVLLAKQTMAQQSSVWHGFDSWWGYCQLLYISKIYDALYFGDDSLSWMVLNQLSAEASHVSQESS